MTDRRTLWRRVLVGGAFPAVAIAAVITVPFLVNARLPGPVYGSDGSVLATSWTLLQTYPVVWTVATVAVATAAQLAGRPQAVQGRVWVAVQWGFATSMAEAPLVAAVRDAGRTGPPVPPEPWWGSGWAVSLAVVVVAVAGFLAAGPEAPARPAAGRPGPEAPRMPLADGERVLWSRSVVSRRGLAVTGFWVALALLMAWSRVSDGPPIEVLAVLLVACVVGLQSWARVRVDGSGVHVTQPLLRRGLVGAGIAEIAEAGTAQLDPGALSWASYGVVHRPDRTYYRAARSGEMLTLELSGDRRLGITVPDAATAAALLNSELDRRRAPAC